MPRPFRVLLAAAGVLGSAVGSSSPTPSRADDFGQFLERAAEKTFRQAMAPQDLQRAYVAPAQVQEHGEPFAIKTADNWTLVAHR